MSPEVLVAHRKKGGKESRVRPPARQWRGQLVVVVASRRGIAGESASSAIGGTTRAFVRFAEDRRPRLRRLSAPMK